MYVCPYVTKFCITHGIYEENIYYRAEIVYGYIEHILQLSEFNFTSFANAISKTSKKKNEKIDFPYTQIPSY